MLKCVLDVVVHVAESFLNVDVSSQVVTIPLMMTTIPSPKEFKRQISSLSMEQQEFAQAYRKMQLSGSLFTIAVVQIKPNLERLLKLPQNALTKEIKLCQDLMELFVEYQIPSDLLSFGGHSRVDTAGRIATVKKHVVRWKWGNRLATSENNSTLTFWCTPGVTMLMCVCVS